MRLRGLKVALAERNRENRKTLPRPPESALSFYGVVGCALVGWWERTDADAGCGCRCLLRVQPRPGAVHMYQDAPALGALDRGVVVDAELLHDVAFGVWSTGAVCLVILVHGQSC